MKKILLIALLLLNATLSFAQTATPHLSDQVIISFADGTSQADRQALVDDLGTVLGGLIPGTGGAEYEQVVLVLVTEYPVVVDGKTYLNEIDLISTIHGHHAKVDHADLNYLITSEQYSFNSFIGNFNATEYSPISASCEANFPGGALEGVVPPSESTVRVGVLDTGLDPYYPTINQYVAGEINVMTDDVDPEAGITISYGYNPSNPIAPDENGHGTAVAGIIAGLSDRAGLSPFNLELYIIKCFDSNGDGSMFNLMQAIRTATLLDLDVMNLSWSYLTVEEDEYTTALEYGLKTFSNTDNGIIVAGAGNDKSDLTVEAYAPASLPNIKNLLTVGGTVGEERQCYGGLVGFSNYGDPVDIAAPAASMSVPGLDGYWALNASGTSFATPIVTAAVIQSWLANEDLIDVPIPAGGTHPIVALVKNTATYVTHLDHHGIEGAVNFAAACSGQSVLSLEQYNEGNVAEAGSRLAGTKGTIVFGSDSDIQVAPNPFSSQLTVSLNTSSTSPIQLELLTMQGARITGLQLDQIARGTTTMSVPTDLPAGPYLLRVRQNDAVTTRLLVKD